MRLGGGFFRPQSRPSRDLGVLLARALTASGPLAGRPLRVLDAMAGCGIRGLRLGLEAGAAAVWANDADPDRLPLLRANLAPLLTAGCELCTTALTAQQLLAGCLERRQRFELVDLDAFGCPTALLPLALEAVALDGALVLASTDGRSATGHDRPAALRRFGAAARAHPASWELALRLQIGSVARCAWALGRGVEPLLAFSEGRTFRTAVRLCRHPARSEEGQLGLIALCHGCGDQQVQPLLSLRQWQPCRCAPGSAPPLAISGPLWIGPLQHLATLEAMARQAAAVPQSAAPATLKLLSALGADAGWPARCWPLAEIARRLGRGGPPKLAALVDAVRQRGHRATASGVMAAQLRSDAPWPLILELAAQLTRARAEPGGGAAGAAAEGAAK
ncbi:N2,N2-dimethylguanosine tRNA methyltransferase [Cyanobium sp. ATX 6A2]|uniref:N2,N2-dimethylguanosine tRNA methyltransferase n=1 Tax=Cyanobium sp. ATX 6A2 TaxID=2823700 RepID=UPI0020CC2119|nr:N2,N2-dimethylguanosine tRNA methyltransferase [Cyanobium sp. ATX 6A2]